MASFMEDRDNEGPPQLGFCNFGELVRRYGWNCCTERKGPVFLREIADPRCERRDDPDIAKVGESVALPVRARLFTLILRSQEHEPCDSHEPWCIR